MKRLILVLSLLTFASCGQHRPQKKFSKQLWTTKEDWNFPEREFMIDDLVKDHKIKGLTYKQLIDSLGEPANWGEQRDSVGYEIITDFGNDIDPVYTKSLVINLNKDSIVTGFKVVEWKKED